jgi:phosphoribosylaminoimidazolecarboxamide formyltransferase / IMP cyclohydrolase
MIQRALLSVHDKTGLIDLAQGLHAAGVSLIASGGTARAIREAGLPVTEVADLTGFPEILGGRVKTLHPTVHAGLLAPRTEAGLAEMDRLGLDTIDLVASNLYPFSETVRRGASMDEAVEEIDIGGVTLTRAAAKNHASVTILTDPVDYAEVLAEIQASGDTSPMTRLRLALKAFEQTTRYDAAITRYLAASLGTSELGGRASLADERGLTRAAGPASGGSVAPPVLPLVLTKVSDLRYGENPHQRAAFYRLMPPGEGIPGLADARQMHGPGLSYTNLLDLDTAGVASAARLVDAYTQAFECDPMSAFGGVVALNRPVDVRTAEAMAVKTDCILAPAYHPDALALLTKKKNLRVLQLSTAPEPGIMAHGINGGFLIQETDSLDIDWLTEKGKRHPTEDEWNGLVFAWRVCRAVKSNAIVLAQGTRTVGIGPGQPNRVDSVRIAVQRAGDKAQGAVLASDAFFPFPDGVEVACQAGVTAFIQPGGSVKDDEAVAMADKYDAAMVFTGMRHFRH